ncbi:MAG: RAB, member of ras oncogene family-like 2A, partial [Olpidium bornovanus]
MFKASTESLSAAEAPREPVSPEYDPGPGVKQADLKIILLGDSAVGKSKLVERYLLNSYVHQHTSTYALTLYRHNVPHPDEARMRNGETLSIDFWDTAGQERFQSMHPSYYHAAH